MPKKKNHAQKKIVVSGKKMTATQKDLIVFFESNSTEIFASARAIPNDNTQVLLVRFNAVTGLAQLVPVPKAETREIASKIGQDVLAALDLHLSRNVSGVVCFVEYITDTTNSCSCITIGEDILYPKISFSSN